MMQLYRQIAALLLCLALLPQLRVPARAEETEQDWNVRYAVSVYGIRQDLCRSEGEGGESAEDFCAGLTFGPATGESYVDSYKAHVTLRQYLKDPALFCIHWMSWEEIAEQSLVDPTVFHDCLEAGCTHAVELRLNDTLLEKAYPDMSGDGCGALLFSIKPGFRCWNTSWECTGGYPASRIRVTLNGVSEETDPRLVEERYMLDADQALFSCFPEELRQRIVAKAVVTDLNYDKKEPQLITCYDKLWLFAGHEIYGDIPHANPSEGPQYERNTLRDAIIKTFPPDFMMCTEKGGDVWAWLRSSSMTHDLLKYHMFGGGHTKGEGYFNRFAVAPGFCLP